MNKPIVAVFGAASPRVSKKKKNAAYKIGRALGHYDFRMIYGAGSMGVMGALADGYLSEPTTSKPLGSTTQTIANFEKPHSGIHLITTESMSEREQIYYFADIVIVLPGGSGTRSEAWRFIVEQTVGHWSGEIWILTPGSLADSIKRDLKVIQKEKMLMGEPKVKFLTADQIVMYLFMLWEENYETTKEKT